jgi:hypothetical protein
MERIKETILNVMEGLVKKKGETKKKDPVLVLRKILTKKELGHIRFNYFRRGTLSLKIDSSVWLYVFNLKKEFLKEEINRHGFGVKEIRFYLGEIR